MAVQADGLLQLPVQLFPKHHQLSPVQMPLSPRQLNDSHIPLRHIGIQFHLVVFDMESGYFIENFDWRFPRIPKMCSLLLVKNAV